MSDVAVVSDVSVVSVVAHVSNVSDADVSDVFDRYLNSIEAHFKKYGKMQTTLDLSSILLA